jgi:hypothetical protein
VKERILVMHDRRRMAQHDRNRVKTDSVPFNPRASDVTPRRARDMLLLFEIDGAIRMARFRRSSSLHFHENQQIPAPRHNIDLRIDAGAVIPSDDRKAHLAQITMGQVFPPLTKRGLRAQDAALAELPCPVAEFPEKLAWAEAPVLSASSCHSMTFPRTT